ncbi:MAG: hypothetical protein FWF82_01590 [Oscillospiraceae bacterium]|nr:hypothetical protein [Oscillospiraceae bacterium]
MKINSDDIVNAMEHIGDDYIEKTRQVRENPHGGGKAVKPFPIQRVGMLAAAVLLIAGTALMFYVFRPDDTSGNHNVSDTGTGRGSTVSRGAESPLNSPVTSYSETSATAKRPPVQSQNCCDCRWGDIDHDEPCDCGKGLCDCDCGLCPSYTAAVTSSAKTTASKPVTTAVTSGTTRVSSPATMTAKTGTVTTATTTAKTNTVTTATTSAKTGTVTTTATTTTAVKTDSVVFTAFGEWAKGLWDYDKIVENMDNTNPTKDTVTFLTSWHGWWGVNEKTVANAAVSAKFNELRKSLKTIDAFTKSAESVYPSGIVCFDDGMNLVILWHDGMVGIMGKSIDTLDQYVEISDEFLDYYDSISRGYPYRYYSGTISGSGAVSHKLLYDGKSDYDLNLTSITRKGSTFTAKFDVTYRGTESIKIPVSCMQWFSADALGGEGTMYYTITGNTTIEFTMEIDPQTPDGAFEFYSGNIQYSVSGRVPDIAN